jgi:hypothetical protein
MHMDSDERSHLDHDQLGSQRLRKWNSEFLGGGEYHYGLTHGHDHGSRTHLHDYSGGHSGSLHLRHYAYDAGGRGCGRSEQPERNGRDGMRMDSGERSHLGHDQLGGQRLRKWNSEFLGGGEYHYGLTHGHDHGSRENLHDHSGRRSSSDMLLHCHTCDADGGGRGRSGKPERNGRGGMRMDGDERSCLDHDQLRG